MELTYDWRSFQGMFYPHRRAGALPGASSSGPVYLVVEDDLIVSVLSEHEDLSDWIGASFHEMQQQGQHRELIAIERSNVDRWLMESFALPHYYDQVEHFRKQVKATPGPENKKNSKKTAKRSSQINFRENFLLDGILGWWGKVLPSSYGVFIRVEGQAEKSLLMLVRRGAIEGFHEPDLTSMGPDRRRQPADVVKYLSEKYLVPVQGMFIPAADWVEWSQSSHPWKLVARSVREERAKLVPFRWGITVLMATRAFFGV